MYYTTRGFRVEVLMKWVGGKESQRQSESELYSAGQPYLYKTRGKLDPFGNEPVFGAIILLDIESQQPNGGKSLP